MGPTNRHASRAQYHALYQDFRQRLVAAREEAGITQRDAARLLGRTQSYVAKSETGERRVDVVEMLAFAAAYGKPPAAFLPEIPPLPR